MNQLATSTLIEPLNTQGAHIHEWTERFELTVSLQPAIMACTEADAKNELKAKYLLSCIGEDGYCLLKASMAPEKLTDKTYNDIVKAIESLAPKHSAISESYKLQRIKQEPSESLTIFMSRLKEVASKCDYGASFDRVVRDKFICGLRAEKLRAHLINDDKIKTASDALTKAIARENSTHAAHDMSVNYTTDKPRRSFNNKNGNQSSKFNKNTMGKPGSSSSGNRKSDAKCSRCTLFGHSAPDCRTRCRFCKKQEGHIAKDCPKKKSKMKVHVTELEADESSDNLPYEEHMFQVDMSSKVCDQSVQTFGIGLENLDISSCNVLNTNVNDFDFLDKIENDRSDHINYLDNLQIDLESTLINDNLSNTCYIENKSEYVNQVNDFGINEISGKPYIRVRMNGKYLKMELDTGSSISSISKSKFDKLNLTGCVLHKCVNKSLVMADGRAISCTMHKTQISIKFRGMLKVLWLYVVEGCFQTLFGADWIREFFGSKWISKLLQQPEVNSVMSTDQKKDLFIEAIKDHEIFKPEIGHVKDFVARMNLKPDYKPKFCNARKVPFSMKDRLGETLDEMEKDGRLVKVDHSEFASPVVPVVKKDGSIRVCGDYKGTLNPQMDTKIYPLPVLEDCFAEMKGGRIFSKLDIKQAYNQIKLKEEDQLLTTINTHQGLYKWTCLSYGLSPAGSIFQATMDSVLKGMRGVTCRVDDILIQGSTLKEHIERFTEVVRRLQAAGFRCNLEKSEFCVPKVIYLGYEISAQGVRACRSKVETLIKAAYPDKLSTLISFLGAVQYYARFIPQLSTIVEPLNRLRTSKQWYFGSEEREAFDKLKQYLASDRVLTFYDPEKPLQLDTDASPYGIGAVISNIDDTGQDRPVEFISRTLSKAERNYSQIEKEGLAIVWAVKRFHRYLYARPFLLYTDNKPLELILGSQKQIPEMGTSRMIRWALTLSHYQYTIKFRPTTKHGNADFCSRYPLPETEEGESMDDEKLEEAVFSTFMDDDKPLLSSDLICRYSKKDPVLSKVMYCVKEGWPEYADSQRPVGVPENATQPDESSEWKAFYIRRAELSCENGCLLWGHRVIIPVSLREEVLNLLHSTHMGMTAMKSLARNYVWWPKLDSSVESLVKHCETCQMNQRQPKKAVPHPWRPAQNPWDRIHLDFAGPFANSMWMLLVDAHSKWVEVQNMRNNTKSGNVIIKLRTIFSRYGLPKILVSDNGPQLISKEFEDFCVKNGINHIAVPPYHPSSNGQIESIVGKFKAAMSKMQCSNKDMGLNIANWLVNYHNTPHSSTGVEPSVRMMGRRVRSALSLVHPMSCSRQMTSEVKQEQKLIDSEKKLRRFQTGDKVLYRDTLHKLWKKGTVVETSDVQYKLATEEGAVVTKHIDHVVGYHPSRDQILESVEQERKLPEATNHESESNAQISRPIDLSTQPSTVEKLVPKSNLSNEDSVSVEVPKPVLPSPANAPDIDNSNAMVNARPKRTVKQPDKLEYSKLGG